MAAGGKRKGAGRKPDPVEKDRITVYVPVKHKEEIKEKLDKIVQAYEEKCKRDL